MKKFLKALGILIVCLIAGVYAYWQFKYPTHTWKQKMTMTVETPTGEKSASSIVEVSVKWQPAIAGIGGAVNSWRGEAIVLNLDEGRYLFALLGNPASMAKSTLRPIIPLDAAPRKRSKQLSCRMRKFEGRVPVDPRYFPPLVTFDDLSDPATIKPVDPDDLAARFGDGYALKSMMLEVTDEPTSAGKTTSVLEWLEELWPNRMDGQLYETADATNRSANAFATGDFSTELSR